MFSRQIFYFIYFTWILKSSQITELLIKSCFPVFHLIKLLKNSSADFPSIKWSTKRCHSSAHLGSSLVPFHPKLLPSACQKRGSSRISPSVISSNQYGLDLKPSASYPP